MASIVEKVASFVFGDAPTPDEDEPSDLALHVRQCSKRYGELRRLVMFSIFIGVLNVLANFDKVVELVKRIAS